MHRATAATLVIGSFAASPAAAQLWNTGPWDGVDGRSSDRPTPAVRPETRTADDFVLPAGNGRPYSLTVLKGRALAREYSGGFAEIFADNAGSPAAEPLVTLPPGTALVLQTGVFGQFDLVEFTMDAAGVELPPGRYWVSVVCDVSGALPPLDGYGYFGTAGNGAIQGIQGHYRVGAGPWIPSEVALGVPRDFSFRLDGVQQTPACYANCDGSTVPPILNVNDFICFQGLYAQGSTDANCDGSTVQPVLNVNDFICFQGRYAQGCP